MKRNKILVGATVIVFLLTLIGCATVFKGTTQDVALNSNPQKASVKVKSMAGVEIFSGTTPTAVKLPKKSEYIVTIDMQGYKPSTVQITQSLEGWFWGNLICGGVIGMIIDYVSGAMWDLEPEQVSVSLVTASVNGTDTRTYAVFMAYDKDGNLRSLAVPLIRDNTVAVR
jgi:hypothetical protein